ncbi:transglycosylase SLT domain-containing protein [Prauserella muralis]|nr:transglycosylase SLT domain-containing protein [Prauserella muralis]TWE27572.1 transglycosylase-like protein with SLT domain [Prauserella muralis]
MGKLAGACAAMLAVVIFLVAAAAQTFVQTFSGGEGAPSATAKAEIPAEYLALYQYAATVCPGLDWAVLAAVGKIESNHGQANMPGVRSGENNKGAGGPMQFLQPTFDEVIARHTLPPGGQTPPSRYDPHDAIYAAAFYLCDSGARDGDLRRALFAYNHNETYVHNVLETATTYRARPPVGELKTEWPIERATIPDPTRDGGFITPRTNAVIRVLKAQGMASGGAACWDPHSWNPSSDHPKGKACDVFFQPDNPADVERGWGVANWLIARQAHFGVRYLIWQGQYWSAENPTWVPYQSDVYGCPNPANVTGCHYDHIHISMY